MIQKIMKRLGVDWFTGLVGLVGVIVLVSWILGTRGQPVQTALLPASLGKIVSTSPTEILVKFKQNVPSNVKTEILAKHDLKEKSEIKGINVKIVSIPAGQNPQGFANQVMHDENNTIEFAEPDYVVDPSLIPNDPWFGNWQKDKQQIGDTAAWDMATGDGSLVLAIVDTGVNCGHQDLAGQCVEGWNFYDNNSNTTDVNGHGTSVAGVAAAVGNNGIGVTGAIWHSKIMPLRVSASDGSATYSMIASAITYAADYGAKVVNNSYQTSGSAAVRTAAGYLKSKGGLLVVSEGNYGSNTGYTNSPNLISVSAVDASDAIYSWSSFGDDVDVSAPGCTGATTLLNGGYGSFCGTSNAAPETTGLLALIWSANASLTPDQVQDILLKSAKDLGTTGWDQYYGWGRIDAAAALNMATQNTGSASPAPTISPSASASPTQSSSVTPTPTSTQTINSSSTPKPTQTLNPKSKKPIR